MSVCYDRRHTIAALPLLPAWRGKRLSLYDCIDFPFADISENGIDLPKVRREREGGVCVVHVVVCSVCACGKKKEWMLV